jgi:chromosomal replication initiator protein
MEQQDISRVWDMVQSYLTENPDVEVVKMNGFFSALDPRVITDTTFILSTTNHFAQSYIERTYLALLKDAVFSITGKPLEVLIVVEDQPIIEYLDQEYELPVEKLELQSVNEVIINENSINKNDSQPVANEIRDEIQSDGEIIKTFENFIIGESNRQAYNVAHAVAENPGVTLNPLFIYGKSGLGKTHLLLAIYNYVSKNYQNMRVKYVQLSELLNDYMNAYQIQDWGEFSLKYYSNDMLLLDDVQYLEGKDALSNEVFNIFNKLTQIKKHIVLSADRAPKDIALDERFTSRFAQGVIVEVTPPTFETKLAIFKNYLRYSCQQFNLKDIYKNIPEEVCIKIVERSNFNIRSLEGAATNLVAYIKYEKENIYMPLTIDEAEIIATRVFLNNNQKITISNIQVEIEKYYNITHAEMLGKQRPRNISLARQVAMYLCRSLTGESYPDIGKAFKKDHSSVVHAYNNIENKKQSDKAFYNEIEKLTELVKG